MDKGVDLYENRLPYDVNFIPNFDGKHGYIILFVPHALVDGVQQLPTFMSMNNTDRMSQLRYVAKPSLMQRILA